MKLKLSDVLDNLLIGEFAQTGWAQDGEFSIATINKIIVLLNAGLGDISSRFWVKRKEVFLKTCKGQTLYVIDKSVASKQSSLQRGQCHLTTSTGEIFEDDLQAIYEVYDQYGNEMKIAHDVGSPHVSAGRVCKCGNKIESPDALDTLCYSCRQKVFTNTLDKPGTVTTTRHPYGVPNHTLDDGCALQLAAYNAIRVPDGFPPQKLRIVYRASAKRIHKIDDIRAAYFDAEKVILDLPFEYLQALLFYVASRKFNSNKVGMQATAMHEGNNYYQKYISACQLLSDQGSGVEPVGNDGNKFETKGFV